MRSGPKRGPDTITPRLCCHTTIDDLPPAPLTRHPDYLIHPPGVPRPHPARTVPRRLPVPPPGSGRRPQVVVDLGPLERARKVHVPYLGLGVELVDLPPALAVAVPGLLDPTEREVRLSADGRGVHVGDPVVELIQRPKRHVYVARVDRRGEAVLDVVVDAEGLLRGGHPDYGQYRPEDLFLLEAGARLDPGEDGGLEEEAFLEPLLVRPPPAAQQVGALGLSDVHV